MAWSAKVFEILFYLPTGDCDKIEPEVCIADPSVWSKYRFSIHWQLLPQLLLRPQGSSAPYFRLLIGELAPVLQTC
jgi:hypothetical protein